MNNTRAAILAVLALSMLVAGGCRRRSAPAGQNGALDSRQYSRLMRYAERHTGCDESVLSPTLISTGPNVYSVTGCAHPADYWQQCSRRRCRWQRIEPAQEVASQMIQCPTTNIQQQMTQSPMMRSVTGCGQTLTMTLGCDGRSCQWHASTQGQQQVYAQPAQVHDAPVGSVSARLSAQVQAQREAVLSCLDAGVNLTLSLRWTEQGAVVVQLPPELAGTPSEGCIHAALGALQVSAQQPGQVRVPIQ
ncbi:MAG: hypothetical protein AB8I08_32685 [Sandaracinaceae bacterium]